MDYGSNARTKNHMPGLSIAAVRETALANRLFLQLELHSLRILPYQAIPPATKFFEEARVA